MKTKVTMYLNNYTTPYVVFNDDEIVNVSILEAYNPINAELQVGTAEITLYSKNDLFNFLNPDSYSNYFKRLNKVIIQYEFAENNYVELGTYYLDSWQYKENNQILIQCVDVIGLTDNHSFIEDMTKLNPLGANQPKDPIKDAIQFAGYDGLITYSTNASTTMFFDRFNWYVPTMSSREYLQQALSVYDYSLIPTRDIYNDGLYVINNRIDNDADRPETTTSIKANKIISQTTTLENQLPIGKSVMPKTDTQTESTAKEIYSNTLYSTEGTSFTQYFEDNYTDYTITNGTITASGRHYVTFEPDFNGQSSVAVTINAKAVTMIDRGTDVETYNIGNAENSETLQYTNNVSWSPRLHRERLIDLYNRSFLVEAQIIMSSDMNERVGYKTKLEVQKGILYQGIITEININVTGGMLATIKVLCDINSREIASDSIITEDGDFILTEADDYLMTEGGL